MVNENIQKIPHGIQEVLSKKKFGSFDIKWIKTVNDKRRGHPNYCNAYLQSDKRVKYDGKSYFFCLQASDHCLETLKKPEIGDLILLYQYLDNQSIKCFTHLVTPIGYDVVQHPYSDIEWGGRWVKVIAMTGNKAVDSIPALTADWKRMPFSKALHNLSYQGSAIHRISNGKNLSEKPLSDDELSILQTYIWNKFDKKNLLSL